MTDTGTVTPRPAPFLQDRDEAESWFAEGLTYTEMVRRYDARGIRTTPSMWANWGRIEGIERKPGPPDPLIPWRIQPRHFVDDNAVMLRMESQRRRDGDAALGDVNAAQLREWTARLHRDDLVVHYDPDTAEGWSLVPRDPSVDTDLIRHPGAADGRAAATTCRSCGDAASCTGCAP